MQGESAHVPSSSEWPKRGIHIPVGIQAMPSLSTSEVPKCFLSCGAFVFAAEVGPQYQALLWQDAQTTNSLKPLSGNLITHGQLYCIRSIISLTITQKVHGLSCLFFNKILKYF